MPISALRAMILSFLLSPSLMMKPCITAVCPYKTSFGSGNPLSEKRTRNAMFLTAVMMVVEVACGYLFGSMALLADGWHMLSHTLALGIAAGAYTFARRHADDPRYAFGTWKVEVLGGYTSALFLLAIAGTMVWESLSRLVTPHSIQYEEAIGVTALGLVVNVVCAVMLSGRETGHVHSHGSSTAHGHGDMNLRAAYVHVIADAATSVLAIVALLGGRLMGLGWLDPVMGLVGAVLVGVWAVGLLRDTGRVLLDAGNHDELLREVRQVLDESGARVRDLHVWEVGNGRYALILSLLSGGNLSAVEIRNRLAVHEELVHITVEICG
jgi:cation diffusion facilitator family transporter